MRMGMPYYSYRRGCGWVHRPLPSKNSCQALRLGLYVGFSILTQGPSRAGCWPFAGLAFNWDATARCGGYVMIERGPEAVQ